MPLLSAQDLHLSFGTQVILEGASFAIETAERICLMGRNGEGKSTLLRILEGKIQPSRGEIIRARGLKVACLAQEVPANLPGTIREVIHSMLPAASEESWLAVETAISRTGLQGEKLFAELSGGLRRRVGLAAALAREPDLLLLDEPTNHLDIPSILWLEDMLLRMPCAILFITHDRSFVRKMATRILELDRGNLSSWNASYDRYMQIREERMLEEERRNALFDKRLAEEEVWIRKGIKARRTRNEGRVRALEAMRQQRSQRREQQGKVRMQIENAALSGRMVIKVSRLEFSWPNQPVVSDFSGAIERGDRVGIIGANGSGKTTLLRLLLGQLLPQSGALQLGTNLEVAYFDQMRSQLREDCSLIDNIGEGQEFIAVGGQKRHVMGYLQDFLFTPDRARGPITALSGGERNRLLLARLFSRPSNVLVLDEPTNDLDVETLDLLEELLATYAGTVLLVSHDRDFLDRVVSSVIVLEGGGIVKEFVGGYSDWIMQGGNPRGKSGAEIVLDKKNISGKAEPQNSERHNENLSTKRKMSFKEKREWDELPGLLEVAENQLEKLQQLLQDPELYRDFQKRSAIEENFRNTQSAVDGFYARWAELEKLV